MGVCNKKSIGVKIFTFLILMFLTSKTVNAIPTPNVVFRFDTRTPVNLFPNGFSSWGEDADLLRHVSGESIHNRSSAYISTTTNWETIEQMARTLIPNGGMAWVYAIRPSVNFYDILGSLLHGNMQNSDRLGTLRQSLALFRNYAWQEEIAAYRSISSTQVMYAQAIMRDENGVINISPIHVNNPAYVDAPPQINSGFIDVIDHDIAYNYYLGDAALPPVSAAFGLDGCMGPNDYLLNAKASICKVQSMDEIKKYVDKAFRFLSVSSSQVSR